MLVLSTAVSGRIKWSNDKMMACTSWTLTLSSFREVITTRPDMVVGGEGWCRLVQGGILRVCAYHGYDARTGTPKHPIKNKIPLKTKNKIPQKPKHP